MHIKQTQVKDISNEYQKWNVLWQLKYNSYILKHMYIINTFRAMVESPDTIVTADFYCNKTAWLVFSLVCESHQMSNRGVLLKCIRLAVMLCDIFEILK